MKILRAEDDDDSALFVERDLAELGQNVVVAAHGLNSLHLLSTVEFADMKDGLLSIELKREIPEAMKPKKIDIGGSQPQHDQIGSGSSEPGQPASKQTVNAEAEHA